MHHPPHRIPTFLSALVLFAASGCGVSSEEPAPVAATTADQVPANLFLAQSPAAPVGVKAARASAEVGDRVTVEGLIGGRRAPFTDGLAMFLVADTELAPCNANPDDKCRTPWDYCCEPRKSLTAGTATVQVTGEDGRPLKVGLDGLHGLEPLAKVIVTGTVSEKDEGVFVIEADGVYVERS